MASWREGVAALRPLILLGVLAVACGTRAGETQPGTGSETHFLSWCSSGSCSDGLDCICGVCTRPCAETASCAELASTAECLAVGSRPAEQSCPGAMAEASCEVACSVDADCAPLGSAHRCDRGFCRRLAADCETGLVAGGEVVLLGDSFLAESQRITLELQALARAARALGTEEQYRDYSSSLITPFGGAADLTNQYAAARDDGAFRIVIMDAGGPDALLSCPEPPMEDCPSLANAVAGADELWRQMADDGVEAVVDFFYPDPESATLLAKFDVLRPMMQRTCEASAVGCHWLDLRRTFEGREEEYLLAGGINPTAAGSAAAAAAIWSLMQQRCIGQ
jgi:hypothetical protein